MPGHHITGLIIHCAWTNGVISSYTIFLRVAVFSVLMPEFVFYPSSTLLSENQVVHDQICGLEMALRSIFILLLCCVVSYGNGNFFSLVNRCTDGPEAQINNHPS